LIALIGDEILFFLFLIYQMMYCQEWMPENHFGAGNPHDLFYFLTHFRFITMYRANFAGRFIEIK